MKRRILVVLGLIALFAFGATPVFAHANLVRSDPPANSAQKVPPTSVRLWFSEAVEPSFSSVSVLDKLGNAVDKKDSHRLADDPTAMQVSLTDLPQGLYTVVWKTMSSVDAHITSGSFSFTVGDVPLSDSSPRAIMSALDSALSASAPPPLYEVLVRWLNLLLLALLVGGLAFPLFVLSPSIQAPKGSPSVVRVYADYVASLVRLRVAGHAHEEDKALAAWGERWLTFDRIILALFAAVTLATLAAQTLKVGSGPGAVVQVLTATRFGAIWIARVVVLIGLAIIFFRSRWRWTPDIARNRLLLVSLALGVLLLVTQSLNSHDAAINDPPVLPFFADLIHLAGVTLWIGGLAQLVVTLPAYLSARERSDRARLLASTIACFSLVAFVTVGIVILSGACSLILQVGSFEAFFNTLYGTTLFVKFLLILPLLALGALNLIVNRPTAAQTVIERLEPFIRRFDIAVALEFIFAAAVLLAVGVMTSVAPARSAYNPDPSLWMETHRADDLTVTLGIAPALVGTNDFDVKVEDARGQNVSNAAVVRLIGAMLEMDMGTQEVAATNQGNGHYTLHGDLLSMVGTWQLVVLVRRLGVDDVRSTFSVLALGQRAPQEPPPLLVTSAQAQAALGLALLGLAIGTASALTLRKRRVRWASMVGAMVIASAGAALARETVASVPTAPAFVVPVVPEIARLARSPIPPVPAQIEIGRQVYVQNCAVCHGTSGKGDGPQAASLTPRPADLTVHALQHTEGELYWWVTHGIPTTAMPAWQASLTDMQRWQVVAYIRTLGQPNPTPAAQSAVPSPAPQSDVNAPEIVMQRQQVDGVNVVLAVQPRTAGLSDFDVTLSDSAGRPIDDAARVMLVTGMSNMTHEANSFDAVSAGGGHYRAEGSWLYMAGPWQIGLVLQLADKPVSTAVFHLQAPEVTGAVESSIVENSPSNFQQVNATIYANAITPASVDLQPGRTVRVTVMLMQPDEERCGNRIALPELNLGPPLSDAGLGELEFTSPRAGQLRFACTTNGLVLEIGQP